MRLLAALYGFLLWLFPTDFRRRFGWQMEGDFEEICREAIGQRGLRRWVPVARAVGDAIQTASREWLRRDVLLLDLRYAGRRLWREKGLTSVIVLTLALGLGTTAAIFSVLNTVVLRPLPFDDPEDVYRLFEISPQGDDYTTSEPTLLDWQTAALSFRDVGAYTFSTAIVQGGGEPEAVDGGRVTHTLLSLLGVRPILGRGFLSEEDRSNPSQNVVILGAGFWRRRFGGDPGVVGTTISMSGVPTVVVGVADLRQIRLLDYVEHLDYLVPLRADPTSSRRMHYLTALGRLAPDVSPTQAVAELRGIAARLSRAHPESNEGWSAGIVRADAWIVNDDVRTAIAALSGAVVILLLLTCANVSNVLVARATTRVQEMGVRSALGASRARIGGQLLTESLLLALLGGTVGIGVAAGLVNAVRGYGPPDVPRLAEVTVDGSVLLFTLGAALATCVVFGAVPAWHGSRTGTRPAMWRRSGDSPSSVRIRDILVVGELALAMVILVGVALSGRSFHRLLRVDPGFETAGLYAVRLRRPPGDSTADPVALFAALEQRVAQVPGVTAAGLTYVEPFTGSNTSNRVAVEAWAATSQEEFLGIDWRAVTPGYFGAMGIALEEGRFLDDRDTASRSDTLQDIPVVIDRVLADKLWGGRPVLGRTLVWSRPGGSRMSVVGVVEGAKDVRVGRAVRGVLYVPHWAQPWSAMTLLLRVRSDNQETLAAARHELRKAQPGMPIPTIHAVSDNLKRSVAMPRFILHLFGLFGSVAFVLASTGVYGVLAHQVQRRTREIGLRVAVGARTQDVLRLVLSQMARRTLLGLLLGLGGALVTARWIRTVLYDIEPTDPVAYLTAAGILISAALLATATPARRAAKVDPARALGGE